MPAKPKTKKRNQGNPNRGTRRTTYRLDPVTLGQLDQIAERAGADTSRTEAIRIAARIVAGNPSLQHWGSVLHD